MRVSKELIDKYHDGKCTPEEMAMVEHWLMNDDMPADIFPENVDKEALKEEIWQEVSSVLPSNKKYKTDYIPRKFIWTGAVAASFLICLSYYILNDKDTDYKKTTASIINSTNHSATVNQEVLARDFTISLGPESNVRVNSSTGVVNFCGAMKFSPSKDIKLSFKDICTNESVNSKQIGFKKGETYIALNYLNEQKNELIIMNENALMELPPLLKRQLMDQFNI